MLREAGFPLEQAVALHELLEQFVVGFVMLETGGGQSRTVEDLEERQRHFRAKLLYLPVDEFPNIVDAAIICAARPSQRGRSDSRLT